MSGLVASRPLRAIAGLLGIWVAFRVGASWPTGDGTAQPRPSRETATRAAASAPLAAPVAVGAPADLVRMTPRPLRFAMPRLAAGRPGAARPALQTLRRADAPSDDGTPLAADVAPVAARGDPASGAGLPGLLRPQPAEVAAGRVLTGSAWAILRGRGAPGLASGGQLGGSQAGVRLYAATPIPSLALTALATAPLRQRDGRFIGAGAALRARTTGIIVERRFPLDRGSRPALAVTGYGGVYGVALPARFSLDGYVQGGVVGEDGFVEGAVRADRPLLEAGRWRVALGAALSGAAQIGVARLDAGPQLVARVPVGRAGLRLSAEWRQRLAGDASPGSGPVIAAGIDF